MSAEEMKSSSAQRQRLNFPHVVIEHFDFLCDEGFSLFESTPTIVRYRKDDLQVNIFHGRRSYEIVMEIGQGSEFYSLAALIRLKDQERADEFRYYITATPDGVMAGVQQLAELVKQYGQNALRGDPLTFAALTEQRVQMARELELDSLAAQIRPKAAAAFRGRNYREAAALYEKIRPCLSSTELKKLKLARERGEV